ncbi:MAG TPA: DUF1800 domain-containing protein, partial [Gemmataceae bacterium]|nr:DUF1800 domain-containing protein [Gemmataceae bacterium]
MPVSIDLSNTWAPYKPSAADPWDIKKVGHLYRRAGFGATWAELEAGVKDGPDKTIDRLLKGGPGQEAFDKETGQLAASIRRANNGTQARAWWLYRMLYSPHPLREKMTLFWHNHFATSNAKVNNAGYMLGQYDLMYKYALGRFRPLLQEMSRDPAMMVWLDTSLSKKGMPNENYARELMELFSLGIGHYTEKDIREAARAFTGWEIKDGAGAFNPKQHDDGEKTVLGKTGKFQGEDVVNICLEQKSAPYFICGKLYRFLINETTPMTEQLLEPLAARLRKSDYDFGAVVETVLRSNLFFGGAAYRGRIKAPVDFALGIVRALEGKVGTTALALALQELGQNVFYPPSVKGWDGGPAWLNGQTLLYRQNLSLALTSTEDVRFNNRTDPAALA